MVKKLLVVDDDKRIREILKQSFLWLGYKVITAENGEEGERLAREEMPDLVILDVMMPVKDGYEACRCLKRDPETEKIPIILLTAKNRREDIVSGHACGADAYVAKPYDPPHLEALVKQLIVEAEEGRHTVAWTGLPSAQKVREEREARLDAGGSALLIRLAFPQMEKEAFLKESGLGLFRDLVHTVAWKVSATVRELSSTAVLGQDEDDSFLLLIHPEEAEAMETELLQAAADCILPRPVPSQPGAPGDSPADSAHAVGPSASFLRLLWSVDT